MEEAKYVLAMYDIRGKQDYIFRTNKIKEIVGASCLIRDCFKDYLYPAARQYRNNVLGKESKEEAIFDYHQRNEHDFSQEGFRNHMEAGYLGEVIYDGGGNFLVLYKNKEICVGINKIFTKKLIEDTGTLKVLCSYVEVNEELADYEEDNQRLYRQHSINEAQESTFRAVNTLPFVQVDRKTAMPLTESVKMYGEQVKLSKDSAAKLKKYKDISKKELDKYGEKILDKLVKEKGVDSQLAVIFIDGNNMGAKVQQCCRGLGKDYESRVNALRNFSADIQTKYVDDRVAAIDKKLNQDIQNGNLHDGRRFVVYAGDEMNFICKAEDAFGLIEAYFEGLPDDCSACAGAAIFYSHAPYAEAYRIAEECCKTGKDLMKEKGETDTCYIDFQYCQGGLGNELQYIRQQEVGEMISKPWLIKGKGKGDEIITLETVRKVFRAFRILDSRTNMKGLARSAKQSLAEFDLEMKRIYARQSDSIKKKKEIKYLFCDFEGEKRRRLVYDIVIIYDQWKKWFYEDEEKEKGQ